MKKKNIILFAILAVIVVLAVEGWILLGKPLPKQPTPEAKVIPTSQLSSQIHSVPLFSANNPAQQLGTALIQLIGQDEDQVGVTLKFEDLAQETAQPAHIHLGSCAELGGIAYPLNAVENSFSQTILNVSIDQLRSQVPLAINTHQSEQELNRYIACADIKAFSF